MNREGECNTENPREKALPWLPIITRKHSTTYAHLAGPEVSLKICLSHCIRAIDEFDQCVEILL